MSKIVFHIFFTLKFWELICQILMSRALTSHILTPSISHIYEDNTSAECYSVLCPFLTKMSIIYRWNPYQMFYLQSSLGVAYHISMRIYKLFNLAPLPKNGFTLVLYCSMSILNQ